LRRPLVLHADAVHDVRAGEDRIGCTGLDDHQVGRAQLEELFVGQLLHVGQRDVLAVVERAGGLEIVLDVRPVVEPVQHVGLHVAHCACLLVVARRRGVAGAVGAVGDVGSEHDVVAAGCGVEHAVVAARDADAVAVDVVRDTEVGGVGRHIAVPVDAAGARAVGGGEVGTAVHGVVGAVADAGRLVQAAGFVEVGQRGARIVDAALQRAGGVGIGGRDAGHLEGIVHRAEVVRLAVHAVAAAVLKIEVMSQLVDQRAGLLRHGAHVLVRHAVAVAVPRAGVPAAE
jgi:hypothetical protein